MRVTSLATALVLCYLARGLGFSPAVSTVVGINRFLSNRGMSTSSTEQQHHLTQPAPSVHGRRATNPTTNTCSMVLRPDWEREGRVFGLGMPSRKEGQRAFEYLVNYPCEFEIKVIGLNEGNFADDIAATVSTACQVNAADVRFTVRMTASGRYQSVTVHAPVKNANMLYRCYELIDEDPRVKFKF